jgi:GNAT superfamily N-acetyltransferase
MSSAAPEFVIEPMAQTHMLDRFDCGTPSLTEWLQRFARTNHQSGSARTYVAHRRDNIVLGYHSLAAGSVNRADAPERVAKGLPNQPVGVVLLARLAVDSRLHGKGLGKALLRDALERTDQAADTIGVRAMLVHALDQTAKRFYMHFNFEPSPVDSLHLMLLMEDLRALLSS